MKFEGKLSLNKETVTKLNDEQLKNVNGGNLGIFRPKSSRNGTGCCGSFLCQTK
jgi:bacteriocin-like protein